MHSGKTEFPVKDGWKRDTSKSFDASKLSVQNKSDKSCDIRHHHLDTQTHNASPGV